ncbi:YopX family protein [Enterococcus malodoratus]|uniref:YopX family protein n=1 Tax=Enterococcus malodoratus TaxID=71451 RepID=UPI003FCFF197
MVIRYRAWDKHVKKIRKVTEIHFDDNLIYLKANNGKGYYCSFSDIELMQSTGLKDKNGVEIFEGDIVLENGIQRAVSFGEQEYEEDFGNLAYYVGFNVYTKWGYSSIDPVEYEILGNIYENPELLEAIE